MFSHIGYGVISVLLSGLVVGWIAARLDRRPPAAFSIAALFLTAVLYILSLQVLVLYLRPDPFGLGQLQPAKLYLYYAGASAILSLALSTGVMAVCVALARPGTSGRFGFGAYTRAAVFSLVLIILSGPLVVHNQFAIGRAIAANEAEIAALRASYKAGLDKLSKLGIVRKIEVDDTAVTHFVTKPLYNLGAQRMAEYARASLIYHLHVAGGEAKPIVLRDAITNERIATYRTNGVFELASDSHYLEAKGAEN